MGKKSRRKRNGFPAERGVAIGVLLFDHWHGLGVCTTCPPIKFPLCPHTCTLCGSRLGLQASRLPVTRPRVAEVTQSRDQGVGASGLEPLPARHPVRPGRDRHAAAAVIGRTACEPHGRRGPPDIGAYCKSSRVPAPKRKDTGKREVGGGKEETPGLIRFPKKADGRDSNQGCRRYCVGRVTFVFTLLHARRLSLSPPPHTHTHTRTHARAHAALFQMRTGDRTDTAHV